MFNKLYLFIAWIFRWPLVWVEDFDGTVWLKRAYYSPFDKWYINKYPSIESTVILDRDNTTNHIHCTRNWLPANRKADLIYFYI